MGIRFQSQNLMQTQRRHKSDELKPQNPCMSKFHVLNVDRVNALFHSRWMLPTPRPCIHKLLHGRRLLKCEPIYSYTKQF